MQKVSISVLAFFALVALIFNAISLGTAAWVVSSIGTFSASFGLWQTCSGGTCVSIDTGLSEGLAWQYWLSRIFSIAAAISSLAAFAQSCRVLFQNLPLSAWITARGLPGSFFVAAINGIVALSAFTAVTNVGLGVGWGYSYILGWCAVVFNLFLAVGAGVIVRKFSETAN